MIREVHAHPHEVTIYAAGPLTNVAIATAIDPHFAELARGLVVMGGSLNSQTDDPEDEKNRKLADAKPRCQLLRIGADLTDAGARNTALREALGVSTRALVLTEGLLLYLSEPQVRDLAVNLAALHGVRSWILDLASPALLGMMRKSMGSHLANAPLKFAPPAGVAYFEALGWRVARVTSILHAAGRMRRLPWFLQLISHLPESNPRRLTHARWSGVVQLMR
jgi:hypothetical protein